MLRLKLMNLFDDLSVYLRRNLKTVRMSINWKGVMPAVTTKFKEDDRLDMDMFEVNIKA